MLIFNILDLSHNFMRQIYKNQSKWKIQHFSNLAVLRRLFYPHSAGRKKCRKVAHLLPQKITAKFPYKTG